MTQHHMTIDPCKAPEEPAVTLCPRGVLELESSVLGVPVRTFETGATRDQEGDKYDYEGFLSPLALTRFAAYMHEHRVQTDGTTRASDNWQKGIPLSSYMKSMWRHLMTIWRHHREVSAADHESLEEALCGVIFNAQGYLHEIMKAKKGD